MSDKENEEKSPEERNRFNFFFNKKNEICSNNKSIDCSKEECLIDCDDCCDCNDCHDCDELCIDKECDKLRFIIWLLENKKFGLKEIKNEIRAIESAVFSPSFGLSEIKKEIRKIESTVLSPTFGLEEIKKEVRKIESTVLSPTFGLEEIKKEIKELEANAGSAETILLNPTFGLPEIKKEIRKIESTVLSPTFGLEEIKKEVRKIESTVLSPTFGLEEIKKEVRKIESTVLSPTFGLEEIKKEIREIQASLTTTCTSGIITTGPVITDVGNPDLVGKVLNESVETRTVTVTLFNLDTCPRQPEGVETLVIAPKCAEPFSFEGRLPDDYELQVRNVTPGVLVFTSTRSGQGNLNPANTFRHSEFVCSTDP